ncbi:ATP-binding domain-containing protein [Rhizobium leguminosarum]|uniref:ATP-binding domain-containing protein n=1 Tax=Rhizobium leguminosarum TaxID=384 RepID=UPI003F9C204F
MYDKTHDRIGLIAKHTLHHFTETAERVRQALDEPRLDVSNTFASVNTATDEAVINKMGEITDSRARELRSLLSEPAVARVVAEDEDGNRRIYFVSRATPHRSPTDGSYAVSYNAMPLGRLAALRIGGEVEAPSKNGLRTLTVVEKTLLTPREIRGEWDSHKSVVQGEQFGPYTIPSLRALLDDLGVPADELDALDAWLAEDRATGLLLEGLRRDAIAKMELRDLAILDEYQDEIFRLPLDSYLIILGPPGTGKTTTLIKRLGQKLDYLNLTDEERDVIGRTSAGVAGHQASWIMFTPTTLLKQYVKEAFARQNVPASDERIQTWSDYRRDLARNHFTILRSGSRGQLVMRDELPSLVPSTIVEQRQWFEDFFDFQNKLFWKDLRENADILARDAAIAVKQLGLRVQAAISSVSTRVDPRAIVALNDLSEPLRTLINQLRADTDKAIRTTIARSFQSEPELLQGLMTFAATLNSVDEPDDDDFDTEEDDEPRQVRVGRDAAIDALVKAMKAKALATSSSRTVGRNSRNGRVIEWFGDRGPDRESLRKIGLELAVQTSLRRCLSPVRRLVNAMPTRYRRFRRERQTEMRWYAAEGFQPHELHPLEVDLILLALLRASGDLLGDRRIARDVDNPSYAALDLLRSLYCTQVLVDEVTDFSPIQLACMGALCDPSSASFVGCGDFNQRITDWGSRGSEDFRWVFPDFDIRSVSISYRHSRQLNELARDIAHISDPDAEEAQLPQRVNNEGFQPVIGTGINSVEGTVEWLSNRIGEIERLAEEFPPIAILVTSEEEVIPFANALNLRLSESNIRVVPCPFGQLAGQDSDVRVVDVRHIKGLEFEAVFFVGIDRLEQSEPTLFEKFLYVGATRAALFLGVTTAGIGLPKRIASIEHVFAESWQ